MTEKRKCATFTTAVAATCALFVLLRSLTNYDVSRTRTVLPPPYAKCHIPRWNCTEDTFRCSRSFRVHHMKQTCKEIKTSKKAVAQRLQFFFVDDKNKVLLCINPKAGATTWKTIMAATASADSRGRIDTLRIHSTNVLARYGIRRMSDLPPIARAWRLKAYQKVIIVRHPFARLVSAYKNKFYDQKFQFRYVPSLIRKYRRNRALNGSSALASKPTWEEFASFVADGNLIDRHWRTYMELCQPCAFDYKAVLKLETLESDFKEYLSIIKYNRNITLPHENSSKGYRGKKPWAYIKMLPSKTRNKLRKIYKDDMNVFGYDVDSQLKPVCHYKQSDSMAKSVCKGC